MKRGEDAWSPGPEQLEPSDADVHVWRVSLAVSEHRIRRLRSLLSPDEVARANRCRLPAQRDAFTVAKAATREVLSRYTGRPADRLVFVTSPRGRPYLAGVPSSDLDFNLSHSGGTALIAVTGGSRVGVDIEEINATLDHRALAHRFMDPASAKLIDSLPGDQGRHEFFTRWTWREAFAKAEDREIPRIMPALGEWALWDLPVGPRARATLAAKRSAVAPCLWDWEVPGQHPREF